MRLVDGDERRLAAREHLRESRHAQPLGRDEEVIEIAREIRLARLARREPRPAGVNALRREAALRELRDLVFHQRDERADHERRAAAREPRELIAE
jgi:hypothetical protein